MRHNDEYVHEFIIVSKQFSLTSTKINLKDIFQTKKVFTKHASGNWDTHVQTHKPVQVLLSCPQSMPGLGHRSLSSHSTSPTVETSALNQRLSPQTAQTPWHTGGLEYQ